MAESVKPRGWRGKGRSVVHTREVRAETLPASVAQALLQMAEKLNTQALEIIDLKQRLEPIEAANRLLAAEARKRVEAA